MSLRPFRFEVDNTGVNPNNLVVAEQHTLQGSGKRFIVTRHGPFYTASLVVVDNVTGQTLAPRTQYTAIQLEEEATLESGKEVCSIIIVDDTAVSADVLVTYQAYGGWMSYSVTGILDMIEALDLNSRTIYWADIVGVPDRYPPAPHAHPLSDIYGWSKLFPVLTAIRDAILLGDQAQLDAIRAAFAAEIARLEGDTAGLETAITSHINNQNNPHGVTLAQVGGISPAQVNALLAGYLAINGTAVNSSRLENRSYSQVRAEIVESIQNSELGNGVFNKANLAELFDSTIPSLIVTAQGWKRFKDFETAYGRSIAELGGYTTAQVNALLAGYLTITGTAANSSKLENRSFSQVRTEIVNSIQNSELDNGYFNKTNLGENYDSTNLSMVLTPGGWKVFKSHETTYGRNIGELGAYSKAEVDALLTNYLGKTAQAADSGKLEGRSFAQVQSDILGSIQNSGVLDGILKVADFGGEAIDGGVQFKVPTAIGTIIVKMWNHASAISGDVATTVAYPGGSFPSFCFGVVPTYTTQHNLGGSDDNRYGCGIVSVTKDSFALANDGYTSTFFFVAFGM